MNLANPIVQVLTALLLAVAGAALWTRFFSAEARRERRRRRNNAPVASRTNRPMVKFSVKTGKKRKKS